MEAIEKLREVAIEAVEHVAMANYASRETEALKMIDDCVDSIRAERVVTTLAEICKEQRILCSNAYRDFRLSHVRELDNFAAYLDIIKNAPQPDI